MVRFRYSLDAVSVSILLIGITVLVSSASTVNILTCGSTNNLLASNASNSLWSCDSNSTFLTFASTQGSVFENALITIGYGASLPVISIRTTTIRNVQIVLSNMVATIGNGDSLLLSAAALLQIQADTITDVTITLNNMSLVCSNTITIPPLMRVIATGSLLRVSLSVDGSTLEATWLSPTFYFTGDGFIDDLNMTMTRSSYRTWGTTRTGMLFTAGSFAGKPNQAVIQNVNFVVVASHMIILPCTVLGVAECNPTKSLAYTVFDIRAAGTMRNMNISIVSSNVVMETLAVMETVETQASFLEVHAVDASYTNTSDLYIVLRNLTASLVCSYMSEIVFLDYALFLSRVTVIIEDSNIVQKAVGYLLPVSNFRDCEVVRVDITHALDVYIQVKNVNVSHILTCGSYTPPVGQPWTAQKLHGVGGQIVYLSGNTTRTWAHMEDVTLAISCRNGSFTNSLDLLPQQITQGGHSSTMFNANEGSRHQDLRVSLDRSQLIIDVGFKYAEPYSVAFKGFLVNTVSLMALSSSVDYGIFSVVNSKVWITEIEFVTAPSTNGNIECFGSNMRNGTTLIGSFDSAPALQYCHSPDARSKAEHNHIQVSIADSEIINPFSYQRQADVLALYIAAATVYNATVSIVRSGDGGTPAGVVDAIGCSACNITSSVLVVDSCTSLAALFSTTLNGVVLYDSSLTASRCSFSPPKTSADVTNYLVMRSFTYSYFVLAGSTTTLSDFSVSGMSFADPSTALYLTYRDSGDSLRFRCGMWNGVPLTYHSWRPILSPAVDSKYVTSKVLSMDFRCGRTPTRTITQSMSPSRFYVRRVVPPTPAAQRGATSSAVVATGIVTAILPTALGFASIPSIQMSMSAVKLQKRSRLLCGNDDASAGNPLAQTADSGSSGSNDAQVGSQVADNPTRIQLGGQLSYSGGTILGNTALVALGGLVTALLRHIIRSTTMRDCSSLICPSWTVLSQYWFEGAIALYGVVLQPTMSACVVLMMDARSSGLAILFGMGSTLVWLLPLLITSWYILRSFPLISRRRQMRASDGRIARLTAARWMWGVPAIAPKASPTAAAHKDTMTRARVLLQYFHCIIEPYRAGFHWMFVVELGSAVLQGIVSGAGLVQPSSLSGCALITAMTWTLFGLSVVTALVLIACRPYTTVIDVWVSGLMATLGAVTVLLTLLDLDAAVDAIVMAQSCICLLMLVLTVATLAMDAAGIIRIRPSEEETNASLGMSSSTSQVTSKKRKHSKKKKKGSKNEVGENATPSVNVEEEEPLDSGSSTDSEIEEALSPEEACRALFDDPRLLVIDEAAAVKLRQRLGLSHRHTQATMDEGETFCAELLEWASSHNDTKTDRHGVLSAHHQRAKHLKPAESRPSKRQLILPVMAFFGADKEPVGDVDDGQGPNGIDYHTTFAAAEWKRWLIRMNRRPPLDDAERMNRLRILMQAACTPVVRR